MAKIKSGGIYYKIKISYPEAEKIRDALNYINQKEISNIADCYKDEKLAWEELEKFFEKVLTY